MIDARYLTGALLAAASLSPCASAMSVSDQLSIYGDFRLRLEADFDSTTSSGGERSDRNRARIRARVGMTFKPRDDVEVGVRLRSGSDDSHQSPHITIVDFDNNDTGDTDFNFDKYYFRYKNGSHSITAGRNSIGLWKQNEFLWDDDVVPLGVSYALSGDRVGVNAGYYTLPVGMQEASGNLGVFQVTLNTEVGDGKLSGALGYLGFESEPGDPDAGFLLDGNGMRDYSIWTASAQFRTGDLRFGIDYYVNQEDYSPTDANAFTAFHHDQDTGYVFSGSWGNTNPGRWLLAYYYANLETFAVNSSYAQDDWVRLGSAVESRPSNIKGHEFRIAYGVAKDMNLVLRAYFVDAIQRRSATATAVEDAHRIRLDLNYKF